MKPNTYKILQRVLIAWVIVGILLSAFFLYQGYTGRQQQALAQARLDQLVHVLNGTEPAQPSQTRVDPAQFESVVEDVFGFLIELVLIIAFIVGLIKLSNRKSSRSYAPSPQPNRPKTVIQELNTSYYLFTAIAIWYFLSGGIESHTASPTQDAKKNTTSFMQDIQNKVALDAIQEYEIVKRNGSATDICVHASFVVAAYLQAKDESNYQRWKITENDDCRKSRLGW